MTQEALEVARLFDKVSTSYERSTRFNKRKQEEIWRRNVVTLMAESKMPGFRGRKISLSPRHLYGRSFKPEQLR